MLAKVTCFLFIFAISVVGQGHSKELQGKVVKVLDGDTIQILVDNKTERIRLAQIDAPEKNQPFGQAAKRYVLEIAAHKVVTVQVETVDRYGRTVGEVFLPNGDNLNKLIVEAGYAWQYRKYSKDPAYAELEATAKEAREGLWQDKTPIPPWEWRKGERNAERKETVLADLECGSKKYCKQMTSCAEARFYLNECGLAGLDRDKDGIPCESLCR